MPFKRRFDVEYSDDTRGTALSHFERLPFDVYKLVRDLKQEICNRSGWQHFRIGAKKEFSGPIYYLYDEDTLEDAVADDETIVVERHVPDEMEADAKLQPEARPIDIRKELPSWPSHRHSLRGPRDDDPVETTTVRDNSTSGRTASLQERRDIGHHYALTMSPTSSGMTSNIAIESRLQQVMTATDSMSPTNRGSPGFHPVSTPPTAAPQSPPPPTGPHPEPFAPVPIPAPSPFSQTSLWLKVGVSPRPASSPPSLNGAPGDNAFTPSTPAPRRASSPRDAPLADVSSFGGLTVPGTTDFGTAEIAQSPLDIYAHDQPYAFHLPGTGPDDAQQGNYMITNLDGLFSTIHHILSHASQLPRYKAIVYFPLHPASSLAASLFRIMGDVGTVYEARTKWGAALPSTDSNIPSLDDFMATERGVLFLNGLIETVIPGTTMIIQAGAPATPTQYNGRLAHVRSPDLAASLLILAPFEEPFLKKEGIASFPRLYPALSPEAIGASQTATERALLQVPTPLKMKLQANLLAHYKSTGIDVKFGRHSDEIRRFMDRIISDGTSQ